MSPILSSVKVFSAKLIPEWIENDQKLGIK